MEYSPVNKEPSSTAYQTGTEYTPQSPRYHKSRSLGTLLWGWKWEFVTWFVGSTALGAIIVLLIRYRDRPLEEWTPGFRLATAIAALSQAAQSSLLFSVSSCIGQLKWSWLRKRRPAMDIDKFEEAARGPKGSLWLLFSTRPHLVSIGALATTLLLGFAPFAQQSTTIGVRNVNESLPLTRATVGRSVQYSNKDWDSLFVDALGTQYNPGEEVGVFHPNMVKGILSGILDDNSLSDVTGTCQAEACTWQRYTTLAVCATVEDISSTGVMSNLTVDSGVIPAFSIAGTDWKPPSQRLTVSDTFWMTSPLRDPDILENTKLPSIADVFIAYYPPCDEKSRARPEWRKGSHVASNWKAFKGTLSLCLQTLNSTFNSTMDTIVLETRNDLSWNESYCLLEPYEDDEICIGSKNLMQWAIQITRALTGVAMICDGCDNYYTGQWVPNIVTDVVGSSPAKCNGEQPPGLEGFTKRMESIAISMSNAMRTDNSSTLVPGTEWTKQQYIDVTYYWLSLPIAIYLAITLFLFATVIKSRKTNTPLWKSSPLALLHAMDPSNDMQKLEQVEEDAKSTSVQLQYTGENWHLRDGTQRHGKVRH